LEPYYRSLAEIFQRAHLEKIHPDGKAITDAIPLHSYQKIEKSYQLDKDDPSFNLKSFFEKNFNYPQAISSGYETNKNDDIETHIKKLWGVLSRQPVNLEPTSSLINLPHPYIVPGGRFGEVYYWDSYFTMIGMMKHGLEDRVEAFIDNFAYLIKTIGYIPNGNREYYLGRSQPPFFSLMIELLASKKGDIIFEKYREELELEYQFFQAVSRSYTYKNYFITTYFDTNNTPRMEMYGDDVLLAKEINDKSNFYRNVRAACESGWDFSSRWLADPNDLSSIKTCDIIPIDLNCLLYKLEDTLGKYSSFDKKESYQLKAEARKKMINDLLWNESHNCYMDYDIKEEKHTSIYSAAAIFPLFMKISTPKQAKSVAAMVEEKLLKGGGITSTHLTTHHQWDAPNGWAPLQWIAYIGLKNYGFTELANTIKSRWMSLIEKVFANTGKLMEKYNVFDLSLEAGGGEYDVQDGFGWTNGVYIGMKYE
jgi:alpha,alpha-trehalase